MDKENEKNIKIKKRMNHFLIEQNEEIIMIPYSMEILKTSHNKFFETGPMVLLPEKNIVNQK